MSVFNELHPKIFEILKNSVTNINKELQESLARFSKLEDELVFGRRNAREKLQKDKTLMTTTLQSIDEGDDESNKSPETTNDDKQVDDTKTVTSTAEGNGKQRVSKKRSKEEVEDIFSPEQEKRQKRNASVKAQTNISKQVNVNLTQKLRREDSAEIKRGRRRKEDDKENEQPMRIVQIKQEKISLPPEPMDTEALVLEVPVKQEPKKDEIAMPPPAAPVQRSRRGVQKQKSEESSEEETGAGSGRRRNTRAKKTDDMPPPPEPSARSTRASLRSSRAKPVDTDYMPPPEPRPKRTRGKKKVSDTPSTETEKEDSTVQNGIGSPAEKPRPKRTRRGQKAAEKEADIPPEPPKEPEKPQPEPEKEPQTISLKEERISQPEPKSPVLQKPKNKKLQKDTVDQKSKTKSAKAKKLEQQSSEDVEEVDGTAIVQETRVLEKLNASVTNDMDKTMVLPNGVYNHAPVTPKNVCDVNNETVVLEKCSRETIVLENPQHAIMNATVVIEKDTKAPKITDDNSLLTDDNSDIDYTPPKTVPKPQPTSAVKEKVQQFEELAARTTRTKTRAMAKMEDHDNHTPPDKLIKPVLSEETLSKMNSLIFNGKAPQVSSSASKPRAAPMPLPKPTPASTSKLSAIGKHREAADETLRREDARRKKEAMLESKRELQKRKREEKMAAAAAAREAAERDRRLAMEAAARERMERQAHADQGKVERLREVERKKQELARKVAETEERRKAEEQARRQRLAEEQKRADAARRKQLVEAEAMKKEAVIMAKEIEKKQKEYIEKQKLKHRDAHTPLKSQGTPGYPPLEPVYMADGFQFLNSDEDEEPESGVPVPHPIPAWSTSKARKLSLYIQSDIQSSHIDAWFSVRVHSPDLREIFPGIERARLKRTSSAVWRTPPVIRLPPVTE